MDRGIDNRWHPSSCWRVVFRLFRTNPRYVHLALAGALLFAPGRLTAEPTAKAAGWDLLAQFLYRDAAEAFAQDQAGGRLRDLGLAAAILNEPPVTPGKIGQAGALLREVAAGGWDDEGSYARYLLARIKQVHLGAPVPEVEEAYRELITTVPESASAQLGAVQLSLLLLYQRSDLAVPARIVAAAELAPVAGHARLPDIAATYFQQLAVAAMYYGITDERVLGWLKSAHALGLSNQLDQSTLSLQVAETARALRQRATAVDYYQRFLATAASTDPRYFTAEMRMRELQPEGEQ